MRTIPDKETLTVEFKSDTPCFPDSSLVDEGVAMSNTDGGDIYLGVEDDGEITGAHVNQKNSQKIRSMIANKTVPPIAVEAGLIHEEGFDVQRIEVPKNLNGISATSNGRVLKRVINTRGMPENGPMYPYEIKSRLTELGRLDFTGEVIEKATVDDIDPYLYSLLRDTIKSRNGDYSLFELTDEELGLALGIIKNWNGTLKLTFAGLVLMGKGT